MDATEPLLRQYGVLACRPAADGGTEVLLITSRDTGRWVVPRGNPIEGLAPHQAAAQEAWEEAGITGAVEGEPVGRYRYRKRRRLRRPLPTEVELYRMVVAEEHDDWPERAQRTRRWFAPNEAAALVDEPDLADLIRAAG